MHYNQLNIASTKEFLQDGVLRYEDSTGLSYEKSDGTWVDGPLTEAETFSQMILYPIIISYFLLFNIFLFYKLIERKNKKSKVNLFMNLLGILLLIVLIIVVIIIIILHII